MSLLRRFEDTSNGANGNGSDGGRGSLGGRLGQPTPPGTGALGELGGGQNRYSPNDQPPPRGPLSAQAGASTARENSFYELKRKVQNALIAELDPKMDLTQTAQVRRTIEEHFNRVLEQQGIILNRQERNRLFEAITAEILGFGPIEPLLRDESVNEIMVNGPRQVYVEQHGRLYRTDIHFRDDDHVMRVIDRIVSPLGRRCDESSPYVDARLPDGSRVNAVIPPISLVGPVITIRKFSKTPLTPEDLIRFGSISPAMVDFLRACVQVHLNVIVSGGTGSGKTTLLNVLSSFIPGDERIITIEDAAELQLRQEHVIPLESRPANIEGKGRISIRDLVANALRMRPDRIVVGECRSGEALDMLQAMNTGHEGRLTADARVHFTDGMRHVGAYVDELLASYPERVELRDQHGTLVEYITIPRERTAMVSCVTVDGVVEPTPVVYALRSRYQGEMLRFSTASGLEHTVSPEHPLYALRDAVEYVAAKDVRVGDWLAAPRHILWDETQTTQADEDSSYWAGAAGSNSARGERDHTSVRGRSSGRAATQTRRQETAVAVAERPTSSAPTPRQFLAGFYDAAGCVRLTQQPALLLTSDDQERLSLAREALLAEGIACRTLRGEHTAPTLSISAPRAISRFAARIPLRDAGKRAALRELCERLERMNVTEQSDVIPCTVRLARALDEATARGVSQRALAARTEGVSQALISAYRRGVRLPTPARLERLCLALEAFGVDCADLLLLARSDLRWERVTAVEPVAYDGYAYDLQVSEAHLSGLLPHNFAADCLLTSNSMTTVHSNSPRDTLSRLETLVLMAGMELPLRAIREQIASAIQLIVHQERMRDGSRKVTNISEVLRMEGDIISMQDLFVFEQTGVENGRVVGRLRPTGIRPSFMERFELANIHLPPSVFGYGDSNWRG